MRFTAITTSLAIIATIAAAEDQPMCLAQEGKKEGGLPWKQIYNNEDYYKKSRAEKLTELWAQMVPDESVVEPAEDFMWDVFHEYFTVNAINAFRQKGDDFVNIDLKTFNTQGLVAQVEWKAVPDNGLAGMYGSGSDTVIARISETNNLWEGSTGHTPGVGIKFMVDGQPSQNILAQSSITATDTWNFFEPELKSRMYTKADFADGQSPLDDITTATLVKKMAEGSTKPFALGVSHPGWYTLDGKKLGRKQIKYKVPYELRFKAPESTKSLFSADRTDGEWYENIRTSLSPGDTLYEVYAYTPAHEKKPWKKNPAYREPQPESYVKIADVVLKTNLHTSTWSDNHLHFNHSHVHYDRQYWDAGLRQAKLDMEYDTTKPEAKWGTEVPSFWVDKMEVRGKELFIDQVNKYGCPFGWLLGME